LMPSLSFSSSFALTNESNAYTVIYVLQEVRQSVQQGRAMQVVTPAIDLQHPLDPQILTEEQKLTGKMPS